MISKINSISVIGVDGIKVEIEVDIQQGLPCFNMVGLPDMVVKESKERVRSAIRNSGYLFPVDKITVNFAPADLKKEGTHLDLAIAVGILVCSYAINLTYIKESIFIGELSLNGEIRPVRGILPMIIEAKKQGFNRVFIPEENSEEVRFMDGIGIYPATCLLELADFLNDMSPIERLETQKDLISSGQNFDVDFSEIIGQKFAKRAVEIAVSGGHNLLMIGPPGGGKTMIAKRIPTILPELNYEQALESTKIYSVAGLLKDDNRVIINPPFRSPHHSASTISIIGGGSNPMPGEVSLAQNGVLFLDELPEFRRDTLEALRQPMEDGEVFISRVKSKIVYPARFMLVSSMNPCPCGNYGYQLKECRCSEVQIRNYLNRISGPLLDRIDIHIQIEPVQFCDLNSSTKEETSDMIKQRVKKIKKLQYERFEGEGIYCNAQMKTKHIRKFCKMDSKALSLLENVFKVMALSTRSYNKILKIARTIADMEECQTINENHIAEAVEYRILDRKYWK